MMKENKEILQGNLDIYDPEEAQFGLHPPVYECPGNGCGNCPKEIKSSASTQRLQLDLNYTCDLGCFKCDRHLDIAPGKETENVSINQIKKLLQESVEQNYMWNSMVILGGEPTLHSYFREIIELICKYRKEFNPQMHIRLASNGYSRKAVCELEWVIENHPEILVVNTSKTSRVQENFVNVRSAPIDRYPDKEIFERCAIPCYGGIGFNYSGFFGCATGGATARIFGLDIGIKSLKDLTYDNLEKIYTIICPLCGHWDAGYLLENQNAHDSAIWNEAIKKYKSMEDYTLTRY